MKIILHRKTEYWNIARPYRVYIDGAYVGSLKNGQTKSFSVEDGQHTVMIKQSVSLFESKKMYVENNGASPIFLEFSTSPNFVLWSCSPSYKSSFIKTNGLIVQRNFEKKVPIVQSKQ